MLRSSTVRTAGRAKGLNFVGRTLLHFSSHCRILEEGVNITDGGLLHCSQRRRASKALNPPSRGRQPLSRNHRAESSRPGADSQIKHSRHTRQSDSRDKGKFKSDRWPTDNDFKGRSKQIDNKSSREAAWRNGDKFEGNETSTWRSSNNGIHEKGRGGSEYGRQRNDRAEASLGTGGTGSVDRDRVRPSFRGSTSGRPRPERVQDDSLHEAAAAPRDHWRQANGNEAFQNRFNGAARTKNEHWQPPSGDSVQTSSEDRSLATGWGRAYGEWGDHSGQNPASATRSYRQQTPPRTGTYAREEERLPYFQPREGDPVLKGIRDAWRGDALYGVNSILAALKARRRDLHKLYYQEGAGTGKHASQIEKVRKQAAALGVPHESLSKHDLNVLTDNAVHQGLVLECGPLRFEPLNDFGPPPRSSEPLWIALDEVTDPHNMGAIIRSATVLGATGVLTCAKNSSPLSPAVSKVSSGAMEHFPIFSCRAMQKTLAAAQKSGWRVLGATIAPSALPCHQCKLDQPTIIVLGNEGSGLRTNVEMACSGLIRIGSSDALLSAGIDSLNVSVAAGVIIHHFLTSKSLS